MHRRVRRVDKLLTNFALLVPVDSGDCEPSRTQYCRCDSLLLDSREFITVLNEPEVTGSDSGERDCRFVERDERDDD